MQLSVRNARKPQQSKFQKPQLSGGQMRLAGGTRRVNHATGLTLFASTPISITGGMGFQ
jgi:hypothetical protein